MSDNEDLLGDDLGDHSLADYNLGNEEEDQLLADDYENHLPQNVPVSNYAANIMAPPEYSAPDIQYSNQPVQYQMPREPECVVPSLVVEVPNTATYAPYDPQLQERSVPPAIPAAMHMESPQIVPSDMAPPMDEVPRPRFQSERPAGAQRIPRVRDIPESLDMVVVPRGRGRGWRPRGPYARRHVHRTYFAARPTFPPPIRPNPPRPDIRPNLPIHDIRPDLPLREPLPLQDIPRDLHPDLPRDLPHPDMSRKIRPDFPPDMDRPMDRPMLPMPEFQPMERPPFPRFFRPPMEDRPNFMPMRPNFDRPMFYRPPFNPRFPPMREVAPNSALMPQVTIRHVGPPVVKGREPEVRMLPVQLPPNLPPGGLTGKKVLINPHFKGNFQPPVEGLGLPAYIPTRINKSPPAAPPADHLGPIKDIDDAAERFIAEQRSALARAATRQQRRSPQRYIENTTIEIENELASGAPPRRASDDDLLRRQEEFINANRAGLRRRMRSPSPAPRSPSPAPAPERHDEESEYRRRMREQQSLRERVLRAKEARRRRAALHADNTRDQDRPDKERDPPKPDRNDHNRPDQKFDRMDHPKDRADHPKDRVDQKFERDRPQERVDSAKERESLPPRPPARERPPPPAPPRRAPSPKPAVPDTTRLSPETKPQEGRVSPDAEVNSTCENLTPPRAPPSERDLTPPLPDELEKSLLDDEDDLDLILGDIEGILSDDEDSGRFKEKAKKSEPSKPKHVDLRSKLPPKAEKPPRQKIVFHEEEKKKKEKSPPPKRPLVSSSTKIVESEPVEKKVTKTKEKTDVTSMRSRQRIIFDQKESEKEKEKEKSEPPKSNFTNRRVILQRKTQPKDKSVFARIEVTDPTKPNAGIFSRAVRTAIGTDKNRIVIKKEEPQIEFASDSDIDEDRLLEDAGSVAEVGNLPHGMTDTRLKTLAGSDVQSLILDKEERKAKITFKTTAAAETFKKKFNNKMVAASRLTVTLR